jgi:hypothetical protein
MRPAPGPADPRAHCRIDQNGPVNERRFLNQFQPQTLVMATILCYIDAFFGLLGSFGAASLLGLFLVVGLGCGAYGIANEKRWAYGLAVTAAVLQVALLLVFAGADALRFPLVLNLLFDGALVALLLHPQSREYQRIWFK